MGCVLEALRLIIIGTQDKIAKIISCTIIFQLKTSDIESIDDMIDPALEHTKWYGIRPINTDTAK